jgi:MFS transporter, SP family, sugar:H+ symporter
VVIFTRADFIVNNSRHLLGLKKDDEARAALAELNGVPGDDPLVQELLEELQLGIKEENEGGKATWLECFSTRNLLWKRTGNGMMFVQMFALHVALNTDSILPLRLQFIQQLNGQNFYC